MSIPLGRRNSRGSLLVVSTPPFPNDLPTVTTQTTFLLFPCYQTTPLPLRSLHLSVNQRGVDLGGPSLGYRARFRSNKSLSGHREGGGDPIVEVGGDGRRWIGSWKNRGFVWISHVKQPKAWTRVGGMFFFVGRLFFDIGWVQATQISCHFFHLPPRDAGQRV